MAEDHRRRALAALVVAALALVGCDHGERFSGRCAAVGDGDSLTVLRGGREVRVRLHGVDCPELGQGFGHEAKRFTSERALAREVTVRVVTRDVHDRLVARVEVDGQDLGLDLVRAGLAWHFTHYSSSTELARAEREARDARLGLWQQDDPVPPWDHRRRAGTGQGPRTPRPAR